jgi:hypothetical protein
MGNEDTIWTTSNIVGVSLACIALIVLLSFCASRLIKKLKEKKHLKEVSNNNASAIREHMKRFQIDGPKKKTWIELSNLCFAILDDYCGDDKEVVWIMNQKVWPIIDDMALQDQKRAISDLKVLGGSLQSQVFPFEKAEWHKAYIKAKKFMM